MPASVRVDINVRRGLALDRPGYLRYLAGGRTNNMAKDLPSRTRAAIIGMSGQGKLDSVVEGAGFFLSLVVFSPKVFYLKIGFTFYPKLRFFSLNGFFQP